MSKRTVTREELSKMFLDFLNKKSNDAQFGHLHRNNLLMVVKARMMAVGAEDSPQALFGYSEMLMRLGEEPWVDTAELRMEWARAGMRVERILESIGDDEPLTLDGMVEASRRLLGQDLAAMKNQRGLRAVDR